MSQAVVSVDSKAPSFARYLYSNHADLGLAFKAKSTSHGLYFFGENEDQVQFRVYTGHVDKKFTTIVIVESDIPDLVPPHWLQDILGKYAQVLSQWSKDDDQQVVVRYVYKGSVESE